MVMSRMALQMQTTKRKPERQQWPVPQLLFICVSSVWLCFVVTLFLPHKLNRIDTNLERICYGLFSTIILYFAM